MKTNWNKTVNEINRKRYVIPAGWDTKEQVADSLECDPNKVADLLKPGIQSGDIEKQDFSVWDEKRRMAVRITCYRERAEGDAVKPKSCPRAIAGNTDERVRAAILRLPGRSDYDIARNMRVPTAEVTRVRASMTA